MARTLQRGNSTFKASEGDSPFAAAVKRIALRRGFTGPELAKKFGLADQSTITHTLKNTSRFGRRGVRPDTAEEYAKHLGVPSAYLRMLATQKRTKDGFTRPTLAITDYEIASRELRRLVDAIDAEDYIGESSETLWQAIRSAIAGKERGGSIALRRLLEGMTDLYLRRLEEAAYTAVDPLGFRPPPRDAATELREILDPIGLTLSNWLKPVREDILFDLWLFLTGTLSTRACERHIEIERARLKARGQYVEAMDEHLRGIRADITYDPTERTSS
jgi:transcriptional regulator with XRE-family HTH domain